jgi:hypothetical protein
VVWRIFFSDSDSLVRGNSILTDSSGADMDSELDIG